MTKKDWLLLVLAAAEGSGLQPVQLQKALFLLSRRLTADRLGTRDFYAFEPYDYGPFSSEVYSDAEMLQADGLVEIDFPAQKRYREYRITQEGDLKAKELRAGLVPEARSYLDAVVHWIRSLSFNDLVEAIYKAFPEMAENSIFKSPAGKRL